MSQWISVGRMNSQHYKIGEIIPHDAQIFRVLSKGASQIEVERVEDYIQRLNDQLAKAEERVRRLEQERAEKIAELKRNIAEAETLLAEAIQKREEAVRGILDLRI